MESSYSRLGIGYWCLTVNLLTPRRSTGNRNFAGPSLGTKGGADAKGDVGLKYTMHFSSKEPTNVLKNSHLLLELLRNLTFVGLAFAISVIFSGGMSAGRPEERPVRNMSICALIMDCRRSCLSTGRPLSFASWIMQSTALFASWSWSLALGSSSDGSGNDLLDSSRKSSRHEAVACLSVALYPLRLYYCFGKP